MNVSAQVRYLDYSVRPLTAKNRRRPGEDELPRRKVEADLEDARPDESETPAPVAALVDEDDDGLGYSRHVPTRTAARRDMVAETVRPAPVQTTAALLSLMTTGDGRPRLGAEPAATKAVASRGDAFYDLLDQVVAQV